MQIASTVSFSSKGTIVIDATLTNGWIQRAKFVVGKKPSLFFCNPTTGIGFLWSGNGKKCQEQIAEIVKAHRG